MTDWYDKSKKELIFDLAHSCELTEYQGQLAYSYLVEIGMIDYDLEKDVLWDLYGEELESDSN